MRARLIAAALCLSAALGAPAVRGADDLSAPSGDAFTFAPAEGPQLKIDRRSGRVSLCEEKAGAWSCTLVPDDREAYEADIARLRARVAELERKVAALEADRDRFGADDQRRLDRFFDFSDKAFRRFFGMVEDLKRDFGDGENL